MSMIDEYRKTMEELEKSKVKIPDVGMAGSIVAKAPEVISASGLSTCLALSIYDPKRKQGALAHISTTFMNLRLYRQMSQKDIDHQGQKVVKTLVDKLKRYGSNFRDLQAKITGEIDDFPGNVHFHSRVVKKCYGLKGYR